MKRPVGLILAFALLVALPVGARGAAPDPRGRWCFLLGEWTDPGASESLFRASYFDNEGHLIQCRVLVPAATGRRAEWRSSSENLQLHVPFAVSKLGCLVLDAGRIADDYAGAKA